MLPKVATNLWHFSAARVAAATQQTVVTPTFRTVLQQQAQAAQASAQQATSVGWNAGANAAGASGATSNAASAKFNAGGRFYNAYQQATQDPAFAATQQDDEEKKNNHNKRLAKRSIRPLQLTRRHTMNPALVISPAAKLAEARLLQTRAYYRSQQTASTSSRRVTNVEESPATPENAVILSPKRRLQQRSYATASSGSSTPGPAPPVPEPKDPSKVTAEAEEVGTLDSAALSAEASSLEMTGVEETGEEAERLLTEGFLSGSEEDVVEEVDDAFPELLQDEGELAIMSGVEGFVSPDDTVTPSIDESRSGQHSDPWLDTLPANIRKRHPSLHAIIRIARERPDAVPNPSTLHGPIRNNTAITAARARKEARKDYAWRRNELAIHIARLREDGVRDSLTWSYALWATIVLRAPGEPLKEAIALYNDLLSGTFINIKAKPNQAPKSEASLEEPRKTWRDIEEDYITAHSRGAVIAPSEEAVALLIRSLALRDAEVHASLGTIKQVHEMFTPLRNTTTPSANGAKSLVEEPSPRDIAEHRAALEKENNFAPAMALVNATLQNRYPTKLGVVTYNLLLQSALNHAKMLATSGSENMQPGVEIGGVPSAITIFAHLEKSGCRPSGRTFALLLQIYGVAGDLDGAKEVWNEFRAACARGSVDWILHDEPRPQVPTQKELISKVALPPAPSSVPWSKKAGPVGPDQSLSKSAIRSMISVWTAMLQTYFVCGDAAGGLAILEKMMDAPWSPPPTGRNGRTLDGHAEAVLTPVDVPPPAANTYFGVVKGFLDTGDTASAIQWFKRLLEQEVVHNMDTFGRKKTEWYMGNGGGKWEPTTHPPRPSRVLWDWMCQALYEQGQVWELNDLMDYANKLTYQQADTAVSAAMERMKPEKHAAMTEDARNAWTLRVIHIAVTQHDKRDPLHWNLVWRTNVSAMENPATSPEDKVAHLDWLRTRMVDRIFFDRDVTSWSLTMNATEKESDVEVPTALPLLLPVAALFEHNGSVLRDRAWHAVGLYVSQGRIDESLFLATKLFDIERTHILASERKSAQLEQKSTSKKSQEREVGAGDKTLRALADLRSLVAGLEERIWTHGSETRQYPSLKGLVTQLRLNSIAGVMPAMRSAWYSVNAFLAHRDDPELLTIFSDNSDWASLAQVFANTAMSVFYEENRPAPNPEMVWQLVTFLQIMHGNGKAFADIGRHNVYRLYKILQYHLGQEELDKLLVSLGAGFSNPEHHFPAYVKRSGANSIPTGQAASSIKFLDVQASVDEARSRYSQASSIAGGVDVPPATYPADENRAIPLKITPAQSIYIHEGVQRRTAGSGAGPVESTVSPLVGFDRLVAGFRVGDVPAPENIARLIVSLSHYKEKEKIIKCYEIGNEVLASLAVNKSWQASGWFALEDAMVTALAHCGDMKSASLHRSRMVAQGSAPSASSYGALIANIKDTTDNAAVAIELFEESRRLNVEPSSYLYNTIISRLAKARKADYAMMLFQAMKSAGLTPTEVTYGAIIAGCARIGDVHTAEVLFEEMRGIPGYQARIPPYNTMMQLYTHVKPNRERALYYYNLMEQMGVQPTPYTYKLLLDVYGKVQPVDIEKMEGVIETMKSRGVELSGNHYSSVIVTRGCAMHDLDGALKVFDSLRHSKRQAVSSSLWPMGRMMRGPAAPRTALPDVLAYEALLTVLVTHHRIDLMQEYLDKMIQQDHVRPTAYINNLLIKGWASVGDLTAAREVFESMLDPAAGAAAPNNHAPHVGINGVQMPNSTITGSPTDPVYREPSSWEAMIRAELSIGDRDRANALLQRMKSRFYPAAVTAKIEGILWAPADLTSSVTDTPKF